MKRFLLMVAFFPVLCSCVCSQSGVNAYHDQRLFQLAPPGALKFGMYGFDNPALLDYVNKTDLYFTWSDMTGKWSAFNQWGGFIALPGAAFGAIHNRDPLGSITDYRISVGGGDKGLSAGMSYGWSTGATDLYGRKDFLTFGMSVRPDEYISLGLVGVKTFSGNNAEAAADLALRPFGNQFFTAFFDYDIQQDQMVKEGIWTAGAVVEPIPGVRVIGRYFDTRAFSVGLQFSLGNVGLESQSSYNSSGKNTFNTYGIHIGAYDRNIFDAYFKTKKAYLDVNLNGTVEYQRYKLFDKSKTLIDLLCSIRAAKDDPRIAGIAINTSGMQVDVEKLWEIREQLKEFKSTGKHVVIFIDRGDIELYHFASIADKIVMDPMGMVFIQGYVTGRTFYKGTLEKLGIGFDEWRYFKYKSADEVFSREKMTDADREQRQRLVDDYYKLAKSDICGSRNIQPAKLDSLMNSVVIFTPDSARTQGLVDTLGRWEDVKDVITRLEGEQKRYAGEGSLLAYNTPPDSRWGARKKIAVIYALGVCDMDQGIKARSLVNYVNSAVENPGIKAIILRVDSPGGDGMASDYISEALRKGKGKKPIIVSQGYVAGSGGYWLSMYGDTIVAAPNTITGSIGVIGGWLYNKGAKEWLGLSTDHVQIGAHADLLFGFGLPILGGLPDRNLDSMEHAKMEETIKLYYKDFVHKVAAGRKKTDVEIDSIGQGRFYSGYEGKDAGLVDVLGGLETAIALAKEKAGIPANDDVVVVEMPDQGLINFKALMPCPIPFGTEEAGVQTLIDEVHFRLHHNGQVMPMMPIDVMEMAK